MKLIRALSEKNKLVRNINNLQNRISAYNSYISGNTPIYNIEEQLSNLNEAIEDLVQVKTKIARANLEMIDAVYRLSELKSLASFFKKLDIKEGKVKENNYSAEVNEWQSELSIIGRDELLIKIELQIETLQMELDRYNFETDI